jgi:hypothetical protein
MDMMNALGTSESSIELEETTGMALTGKHNYSTQMCELHHFETVP